MTHFVGFKSVVETNTILGKRYELAQMVAASFLFFLQRSFSKLKKIKRYSVQLELAPKKSDFLKLILQSFLYFCPPNKGKNKMLDRLQIVKQRFDEISDLIIQPDVIAAQKRYVQ